MKFILAALLMLVLGDIALAHGANTSKVVHAVTRFIHASGEEARSSVFTR